MKIFILFFFIRNILNLDITKEYIDSFTFYANEICSYNGIPTITSNSVTCSCFKGYTNSKKKLYINGIEIQCSYKKKKRFMSFFFAVFLPIGLDYFYLERYIYFIFILLMVIFIFGNQLICFLLSHKFKAENNNIENNTNNYGENNKILNYNNYNKDESDIDIDVFRIYKTINFILSLLFTAFWVIDAILQATGKIKDGNGIKTDDDMSKLFNVRTYN